MIIMLKEGWYTPRVQGAEGTTEETDEQTMKKGRETWETARETKHRSNLQSETGTRLNETAHHRESNTTLCICSTKSMGAFTFDAQVA